MTSLLAKLILGALLLALLAVQSLSVYMDYRSHHKPLLETRYQKVVLRTGEVWYGRMVHLGTDHPVLRGAFQVQTAKDGSGSEIVIGIRWLSESVEGGDHLIFPREAIVTVQPVRESSAVGKAVAKAIEQRTGPLSPGKGK